MKFFPKYKLISKCFCDCLSSHMVNIRQDQVVFGCTSPRERHLTDQGVIFLGLQQWEDDLLQIWTMRDEHRFFFSSDKHVTRTIWSFFKSAWKTIWIQIMFSRRSCLLALCLSPLCVDKPQSRVKRPSEADWSQCQQSWDSFQPKAVQPVWNVCQAVERNSQRSYQNI